MSARRDIGELMRRADGRPLLVTHYLWHRVNGRVQRERLRRTYPRRITAPVCGELRLPVIDPPVRRLALLDGLRDGASRVELEAERALAHEFDLLGSGWTALGGRIDWQQDFKSGYRWKPGFYQDVQVTRLTDTSDAKVPWELSRGHQFLALARAAVLIDGARYLPELEAQLSDWIDRNPPGVGINWANAMECGIRATNWIWTLATLQAAGLLQAPFAERVAVALGQHGRHIAANLEGSPLLRSNHFLADLLGLLAIGSAIPDHPDARRWRRCARRGFEREVRRQVLPDGLDFESSLPYHGLVLEMLLLAWRIAWHGGRPLSDAFRARLERMLRASRGLRHPDGRIPQFGDGDSGRILPLDSDRPPSHDHLIWLGAGALGDLRPLPGEPDPEVAWTLGLDAWAALRARPYTRRVEPGAFPDAGIHVLRAHAAHVVVRAGGVGQNGNGGHAHNDLLSFELSVNGVVLVVDRGTFVYTADPDARNAYRRSASHNTVVIAGREINPFDPGALFKLPQHAEPLLERWSVDAERTCWRASHDGYRDLEAGVRVRRSVTLEHESAVLRIDDEVVPDAPGTTPPTAACSSIHLAPGASAHRRSDETILISRLGVEAELSFRGFAVVALAETQISDRYGGSASATVVRAETASGSANRSDGVLRFGYSIEPIGCS